MRTGMVSTVRHIDERNNKDERMMWSVKEVAQELGVSVESFDERSAEGEIPSYRISKNAALRPGTNPANPCVQAVVEDLTATRRAIAGQGRRRAQQKRPRSVKRGRNFHGSSRRIL